jgi:hypothetical protein
MFQITKEVVKGENMKRIIRPKIVMSKECEKLL